MSLKQYNIAAREQVEHSRTKQRPVISGQDSYVPGGDTETYRYTGPWAAMLSRFNALDGSLTRRLEATLTRSVDGNFGELDYTYTTYIPAKEAVNADPESTMPGSAADNPCYDLTTSEASVPILLSPLAENLTDEGARALKMLIDGFAPTDMFDDTQTIEEVAKAANEKLYEKVSKGISEYLVQRVTLTARYKSASPVTGGAMQIKDPPGPFGKAGNGRNWLFLGATQNMSNGEIWVTETYKLSGPGGWDEDLY